MTTQVTTITKPVLSSCSIYSQAHRHFTTAPTRANYTITWQNLLTNHLKIVYSTSAT